MIPVRFSDVQRRSTPSKIRALLKREESEKKAMLEFETIGVDGKTYMHYDKWHAWRNEWMNRHPERPGQFNLNIGFKYWGSDLNLYSHTIEKLYYEYDKWAIVSDVYNAHVSHIHQDVVSDKTYRFLIRNDVPGEQVMVNCDCSSIVNEPWGKYHGTRFILFREQWWQVTNTEWIGGWRGGAGKPVSGCYPRTAIEHKALDELLGRHYFIWQVPSSHLQHREVPNTINALYNRFGDKAPMGYLLPHGRGWNYKMMNYLPLIVYDNQTIHGAWTYDYQTFDLADPRVVDQIRSWADQCISNVYFEPLSFV